MTPKYSIWEALQTAIALGTRALEEIRTLARTPGPPGEPGLGFDDFDIEHDGERNFTFVWARGEQRKSKSFKVPVLIYREVFKDGSAYERGDVVTWGGSSWVAKCDTKTKPGEDATWTLSTKKGRDGKDVVSIKPDLNKPVKI
jgi:hypothetical protein